MTRSSSCSTVNKHPYPSLDHPNTNPKLQILAEYDQQNAQSDAQKKKTTSYKVTSFPGFKGKEEEKPQPTTAHHKKKEEEENVGEEDSVSAQADDSVQVNSPEKEASIAEAKPVGE